MKVKILVFFVLLLFSFMFFVNIDEEKYLISRYQIGCCKTSNDNVFLDKGFSFFRVKRRVKEFIQDIQLPKYFFFKKNKLDYKFILSKNDKKFFDSIKNIGFKNKFLTDSLKSYRNAKLIYNDSLINIKVKYRGSDITPFFWNSPSLKIKSKNQINGYLNFNIVSGLEMDYKNIFFNQTAKKFDLYAEGPGEIVSFYFNEHYNDGYLYEVFDSNYVKYNYGDSLFNQFKNYKNFLNHSGEFDNVFYNNEKQSISNRNSSVGINKHKKYKSMNLILNKYEEDYFAKYMSLLYLFGNSHQITGDNLTFLDINHNFIPLFRNEGDLNFLNVNKKSFDNVVFEYEPNAPSYDFFKKMILKDSFRFRRNVLFKKILTEKEEIKNNFDSG